MKVIALSKKPRAYILKDFRDEENPPTFTLRSITKRELLQIQTNHPGKLNIGGDIAKLQTALATLEKKPDDQTDPKALEQEALAVLADLDLAPMTQAKLNILSIQIDVLRLALSGWKNVSVSDTETLPFSKDNIDCLDDAIITELANESMGIVTPADAENLEEASTSPSGPETANGTVEEIA